MTRQSDNEFNGEVTNIELIDLFGGAKPSLRKEKKGKQKRSRRKSGTSQSSLGTTIWHRLYVEKERQIVIHLKQLIKRRKRIAEFRQTAS